MTVRHQVFRRSGVDIPSARALTVLLHLFIRLIEIGRWLGLVPTSTIRFGGKRLGIKVLPIKALSPPAPVGLVTVNDRTPTPLAERFVECGRKIAKANIGSGLAIDARPRPCAARFAKPNGHIRSERRPRTAS